MLTGKVFKTPLLLAITISALIPAFCMGGNTIDSNYKRTIKAYQAQEWERADKLSSLTLKQIDSRAWKDWIYTGERKPFMTYFTGDYVFLATNENDQEWKTNKVLIYDPRRDELIRVFDHTPWHLIGSTHTPNYTITYLMRDDFLGYKISWFEKGNPENEKIITREGIESVSCDRLIDRDFVDILERGPNGISLVVLDPQTAVLREIHDFGKKGVKHKLWAHYKVVRDTPNWKFLDKNILYSLNTDTWETKSRYELPFYVSEFDVFKKVGNEKVLAVRGNTLHAVYQTIAGLYDETTIQLPFPLEINHHTKKFDTSSDGEWFAQSDTDSLRIFTIIDDRAKLVHSSPSCLGGSYALFAWNTFWKGDTLVHYGNQGLKIFKGSKLIKKIEADNIFIEYYDDIETFLTYQPPSKFSVIPINTLKPSWTAKYNASHEQFIDLIKNTYISITHLDGTSLLDLNTGEEVFFTPSAATRSRIANSDTTKIILRGDNYLGVFEIPNRTRLKSDMVAVSASSKWALGDTSGALQNVRQVLPVATTLSGNLPENLLEILESLDLKKESIRLTGNMAVKTGEPEWTQKLRKKGAQFLIQPALTDFFGIVACDKGIFAFPVIIQPFNIANGEPRMCYWFAGPDYEPVKRMLPICGIAVTGEDLYFYQYKKDDSGKNLEWRIVEILESGEFVDMGPVLTTPIDKNNPNNQMYADYQEGFQLTSGTKERTVLNFSITKHNIGQRQYTFGLDKTGAGNNWCDSTIVNAVRVGSRFYAHKTTGNMIATIAAGSQADSIGMAVGDIVVSFGGYPISNTIEVNRIKTLFPDRAPMNISVLRDGNLKQFTVLNGRIGYMSLEWQNLVEIDPVTGKHLNERPLPPGYSIRCVNSGGDIIYSREDTLLFLDPVSFNTKKTVVKDINNFERMYEIPDSDVSLFLKPGVVEIMALDISKTANDADRVLWKQHFENIFRISGRARFCFTDDLKQLPILLDNGTILLLDGLTGSVLSREVLPFQNYGYVPQIHKGTFYGVVASRIFGWNLDYFHPPFPWKSMGYGAIAIIPLFIGSLLVSRVREKRLRKKQALELERAEMEAEFSAARKLQASLIPTGKYQLGQFDLVGKFVPASEVGGDYFDFRLLDDGRLVAVMGDVSGHGLPAGILVSMAKASLMTVHRTSGTDFHATLESLNEVIRKGAPGKEMFMTLCYLVIDPKTNKIGCSANGHPFPLLARKDGTVIEISSNGGYPLGVRDNQKFEILETDFNPGDTIVMYTDGLPEQLNENDEPWGYDNFNDAFQQLAGKNNTELIVDGLLEKAKKHTGTADMVDDMAVVAIHYNAKK